MSDHHEDCYTWLRQTYEVPAHPGVVVAHRGRRGRLVGKRGTQQYVYVLFEDTRVPVPCHPTDELVYLPTEP